MIGWSWGNLEGSIVRLLQKIFRGYSDADCWNLNITFSEFILPLLRRYRNMERMGIPAMIMEEEVIEDYKGGKDLYYEKKWNMILDKMITAFGLILREDAPHSNNIDLHIFENWQKSEEIRQHKIEEGLMLFAKYFQCLWD